MREYPPSEPVGWVLPLGQAIERANAYLRRGFFGSRPFSTTNALLTEVGLPPIDWSNTNLGDVDQANR